MPKTASQRESKRVVLETTFAGIPAGSILFVATPDIVAQYIRKIPWGTNRSIEQVRRDLAKNNKSDATCPVSTSIFLRIVAQEAMNALAEGRGRGEVTPFWRVIDPGSKIADRLGLDKEWIEHQRALEAA